MSWRDLDWWKILWRLDLFERTSIQYETSGMEQELSSLREYHMDFDQAYAWLLVKISSLDQEFFHEFSNLWNYQKTR